MSPKARRAAAYRIFCAAVTQDEATREAFLAQQCAADPALLAEVRGLIGSLQSDPLVTAALRGAQPAEATRVSPESLLGHSVGRFRLLECIGQGGMGIVYRAERTDGVRQTVAVKLVATQLGAGARARFEREAQLLASLEHPNIARLIDAGIEDSQAWIALEYVRGERIDAYSEAHELTVTAIIRLVVHLASAVAAAHALLIVHSDIKPANVLVGADGLPKLLDFGIATALRDVDAAQPDAVPALLFTPHYAAPEQLRGERVTVATDVFGLGALAYRLLSSVPPYPEAGSALAYLRAVREREAAPLSHAAQLAGRPAAIVRRLRGDLDAVLARALARDPSRRYASVMELQADLQRYLEGRPVSARAATRRYRLGKFLRRNALAVGLSGLLGASIVAGVSLAWVQLQRTALARDMAARRGEFLESMLSAANPQEGRRDITVAELLDGATRELDRKFGTEPLVAASMLGLLISSNMELGRYPEALAASDRQLALLRNNGASAHDIALAMSARGDALSRANRYPEAEAALKASIAGLRGDPADNTRLVETMGMLAGVYANTNRNPEAEAEEREAIRLDQHGTGFPEHQLAVTLANMGRYQEAERYARESLDLQRRYLPADNPTRLINETAYATILSILHRPREALPLTEEVYARSVRVLGPDHPDALVAQMHVGEVLFDLGRYAESAAIALHAAETLERVVGIEHRFTLGAWIDYAEAACQTGEAGAGLAAVERIAAIRERTLPPGDWRVATAHSIRGMCLARLRRFSEAEPLLRGAAADLEVARGASFFPTQMAFTALRDLYTATGKPAEAAVYAAKIEPVPR